MAEETLHHTQPYYKLCLVQPLAAAQGGTKRTFPTSERYNDSESYKHTYIPAFPQVGGTKTDAPAVGKENHPIRITKGDR